MEDQNQEPGSNAARRSSLGLPAFRLHSSSKFRSSAALPRARAWTRFLRRSVIRYFF